MSAIDVIFPKVHAKLLRLLVADPAKGIHHT